MLRIGLWVTLAMGLLSGCPQEAPPCNATSCPDGCCTAAGECRPGNDKAACGTGGLFCRACDPSDTCADKRCDLVRPDAGQCPSGFHRCQDTCASNDDIATCGSRCTPCPFATDGTVTCTQGQCGVACRTGFHACGTTCADDTSPSTCGNRCGPCAVPSNARAECTSGACDFTCANGFHRCGDACAANDAPESCGGRCTTCPAPANATPTCVASRVDGGPPTQACDFACNEGFHRCGDQCLSDVSPASCGTSCVACPTPANGAAACAMGRCDITCAMGFNACNGACAPSTSVTACGAACQTCTAPDGGSPVCQAGSCAYGCASGFNPCNGECASATDVLACGASCTRCPNGVPGSLPTCDGTSCSTTCAAGLSRCGGPSGSCVGDGIAAACGAACTACPAGTALERPTCAGGVCATACIDTCSAACVDRQRDGTHCGACGNVCGAQTACVEGRCRPACPKGLVFAGVAEQLPHALLSGADARFWAVDVSGDGRLDVLATAGTSRFTWVNDGNAAFLAPTSADAGTTLLPLGSADFTLDGRADLIAGDNRALWVVQQGTAGFSSPLVLFTNGQSGVTLSADFTGDGRADLLRVPQVANLNADFWVNQSADGGQPFTQTRNAAPNLQVAGLARAGELTGDGRADVVTALAGQLRTFVTSGATTFTAVTPLPPVQNGLIGLAVAEVTNDTHADVVSITSAAIFVWAGSGSGALAAPTLVANGGSTLAAVEAVDLDQDGRVDLALGTGRGLEVLWGTPAGFTTADVFEVDGFTPASPASSLATIDLTGDGRLDVVLSNATVRPVLVRGLAGRGFERPALTPLTGAEFVLVGKLDGDADDDVIVSRRASVVSMLPVTTLTRVLLSAGDGGFTVGPEDALTKPEGVSDFDGDGAADLVRLDCPAPPLPDGGISTAPVPCFARVEFGASLRFGAAGVSLALNEVASEVLLRTADFDADGRVDVLARTRAGFWVFHNQGARQFAAGALTPFVPWVQELVVADMDRDGRPDLVVLAGASTPRTAYVLSSRGSTFALAPRIDGVDFETGLVAGLATNDSFPDIVLGGGGVLLGGAGLSFSRGADWRPAGAPTGVSFVNDLDGDGAGEIVSRQFTSTILVAPGGLPRGFAGRVERFADVTGDGVPDWLQVSPTELAVGAGRCR